MRRRKRTPTETAFIGPGHKRHAFFGVTPACNTSTAYQFVNHCERYVHEDVTCARCRNMIERIKNGYTPDHLEAALK